MPPQKCAVACLCFCAPARGQWLQDACRAGVQSLFSRACTRGNRGDRAPSPIRASGCKFAALPLCHRQDARLAVPRPFSPDGFRRAVLHRYVQFHPRRIETSPTASEYAKKARGTSHRQPCRPPGEAYLAPSPLKRRFAAHAMRSDIFHPAEGVSSYPFHESLPAHNPRASMRVAGGG